MIDYRVSYAIETPAEGGARRLEGLVYTVYKSGITEQRLVVTDLTPGTTYSFVVQARNLVGYSEYSNPVSIKAAQIPDAPESL